MQDLAWQCPRSHNLRPYFQRSLAQLLSLVLAKLGFPSVFVSFSYSELLETQRGSVFTRLSLTSALSFLLRRYSSAVATASSKRASLASCQLCPCKAAVYSTDTIATPPILAYISLLREVELHQCYVCSGVSPERTSDGTLQPYEVPGPGCSPVAKATQQWKVKNMNFKMSSLAQLCSSWSQLEKSGHCLFFYVSFPAQLFSPSPSDFILEHCLVTK